MKNIKVGYIQFNPKFGKIKKNVQFIIDKLKNVNADLIILPELFNTGYNFINKNEVRKLSEPIPDGYTTSEIIKLAKKNKTYIVGGIAEIENGELYNSAFLVGPEGYIGKYRKIHLFYREKIFFESGNLGLNVFKTKIGNIGILICFDWIFPEAMRTLALKGSQIIAHPTNLVLPFYQKAAITRALENRVFIILSNRFGREFRGGFEFKFTGQSEVISPKGEVLVKSIKNKVDIKTVTIDPSIADNKNITEVNNLFLDRKPKFYK